MAAKLTPEQEAIEAAYRASKGITITPLSPELKAAQDRMFETPPPSAKALAREAAYAEGPAVYDHKDGKVLFYLHLDRDKDITVFNTEGKRLISLSDEKSLIWKHGLNPDDSNGWSGYKYENNKLTHSKRGLILSRQGSEWKDGDGVVCFRKKKQEIFRVRNGEETESIYTEPNLDLMDWATMAVMSRWMI